MVGTLRDVTGDERGIVDVASRCECEGGVMCACERACLCVCVCV